MTKNDPLIDAYDFMSMIPDEAITNEQPELVAQGLVEYRWRILKKDGKTLGEISIYDGDKRYFRTLSGSWVENTNNYGGEAVQTYYYYATKD